jgi:hypothetical protein
MIVKFVKLKLQSKNISTYGVGILVIGYWCIGILVIGADEC